MGDPKKLKKKYEPSAHPWKKSEIEEGREFRQEYGLKIRKELLIANSFLKKYKDIAKRLIADTTRQGGKEKEQMLAKLQKLGLLPAGAQLDNVLSLNTKDILERRLQTLVFRKGMARTASQARQFITHRHISVGDKEVTSPGKLLTLEEESKLSFKQNSALSSELHPERVSVAKEAAKEIAREKARIKMSREAGEEKLGESEEAQGGAEEK